MISPLLFQARIGDSVVPFAIAVWIGIVGLSFSIGVKDEKVNLKLIKESLTKDIKSTLRLIIAGLIASSISAIFGEDPMFFAVFPISGLSFGIALGLPKSN